MFEASSLKKIVLFAASASFIAGCSLKKDLDEMHDSTVGMKKTTDTMSEDTAQLKALTKEVRDTTQGLGDLQGHGGSEQVRKEALKKHMAEAESMAAALEAATVFTKGIEFQIWQGPKLSTLERRQEMVDEMMSSYMELLVDLYDRGVNKVDTFSSPAALDFYVFSINTTWLADNASMTFNALAATSNMTDRIQDWAVNKYGVPVVTPYTEITKALAMKADIQSGKIPWSQVSKATVAILNFEKIAVLFLQARHNMISTLALRQVSNLENNAWQFFRMRGDLFFRAIGEGKTWPLQIESRSVAQLRETARYLKGAVDTINFLKGIKVQPVISKDLTKIWNRSILPESTQEKYQALTASLAAQNVDLEKVDIPDSTQLGQDRAEFAAITAIEQYKDAIK